MVASCSCQRHVSRADVRPGVGKTPDRETDSGRAGSNVTRKGWDTGLNGSFFRPQDVAIGSSDRHTEMESEPAGL